MKRFFMSIVTLAAVAVAGVSCLQLEHPVLIENLSEDEIVFGTDAYFEAQTKASSGTSETTSLTSFYVSAVTGSAGSESLAWPSGSSDESLHRLRSGAEGNILEIIFISL